MTAVILHSTVVTVWFWSCFHLLFTAPPIVPYFSKIPVNYFNFMCDKFCIICLRLLSMDISATVLDPRSGSC